MTSIESDRAVEGQEATARWHTKPYIRVLIAIAIGALVGYLLPDFGVSLKPIGDALIKMIKMIIAPIVFLVVIVLWLRLAFVDQAIVIGHSEPADAFGRSWRMMNEAFLSVILLVAAFWLPFIATGFMVGHEPAGVLADMVTPAWTAVLTAAYLQLDHVPPIPEIGTPR